MEPSAEVVVHNGGRILWIAANGQEIWKEAAYFVAAVFLGMLSAPWEKLVKEEPAIAPKDAKAAVIDNDTTDDNRSRKESSNPLRALIDKWRSYLKRHPRLRIFGIRLAVVFWASVIAFATSIWIDTLWWKHDKQLLPLSASLIFPAIIVTLTFTWEGMEAAYTELRDKDQQQLEEGHTSRIVKYIRNMGEEEFFDAREWAIIALLVWATLLMEQKVYYIPWVGVVDATHEGIFSAIRISLTVALTAFALVWVAQSPGKAVARKNSFAFLSYFGLTSLYLLRFVWWVLSVVGLQYPSEIADKLFLRRMKRCQEGRSLIPSDLTFFADGLKKYGYGFLISDDTLIVDDEGSITLTSRTLHYVGDVRGSIKRGFNLEQSYVPGIKEAIEAKDPSVFKCWAIEGPPIGERADEALINLWGELFYSPLLPPILPNGYTLYPTSGFEVKVDISDPIVEEPDPIPTLNLMVELSLNEKLPRSKAKTGLGALLILLETTVKTVPGAFPLPTDNNPTCYPYYKKHSHPCLRSSFIAHLPQQLRNDPSAKVVFVNPRGEENFTVTYDGIPHTAEQKRFFKQERYPEFNNEINEAPKHIDALGLHRDFVCFMDSCLPAARYRVQLNMKRLNKYEATGS